MKTANNTYGEQWHICDRCGFSYPMSMQTRQDGLLVCKVNCVYDKGRDYYIRVTRIPTEGDLKLPDGDEVSS